MATAVKTKLGITYAIVKSMFIQLLLYALFLVLFFNYCTSLDLRLRPLGLDIRPLKNSKQFFNQVMSLSSITRTNKIELVKYKYFKELVYDLFKAKKTYGAPIDKAIGEIKKALSKDIYFEKKISSSLMGGIFQMLTITVTGLMFILMSCFQLKLKFPYDTFAIALSLNGIGMVIYVFLFYYLKIKYFGSLERIIKCCYLLRCYLRCQMPVISAISKVHFSNISISKNESYIKERIDLMLQKIKEVGYIDFTELDMQIDEIWLLFEFKFESFQKTLSVLKLGIITLFFLTSYLYVIYSFISMIKIWKSFPYRLICLKLKN